MLKDIITQMISTTFEKEVGKGQNEKDTPKMMHIGINLYPSEKNEYDVYHMFIYAPMNYVYVAVQEEIITNKGKRKTGDLHVLCYHDSCWRAAVNDFIFRHENEISSFRSFTSMFGWYDVLDITKEEADYLHIVERFRNTGIPEESENPFKDRGFWKD